MYNNQSSYELWHDQMTKCEKKAADQAVSKESIQKAFKCALNKSRIYFQMQENTRDPERIKFNCKMDGHWVGIQPNKCNRLTCESDTSKKLHNMLIVDVRLK